MRVLFAVGMLVVGSACLVVERTHAAEPIGKAIDNTPDEPMADQFSMAAAVRFLDDASVGWTQSRQCFTCHTNYIHLIARPLSTDDWSTAAPHAQTRTELEKLVEERWVKSGPRWDAEVIMSAAVLAINDAATSGKLHATTKKALDRMWSLQREDGGFTWLKCGWPPMESDDDYGIAIAALAAAAAPDEYVKSDSAKQGIARLRSYLEKNPPPTLHHRAMLLWPERYGLQMLSDHDRDQCIKELVALQKPDGGWSAATLADWKRADGKTQDSDTSDAYGTAFVLVMLQQVSKLPSSSSASSLVTQSTIERGQTWLKSHQRASGRWHARSLNKDSKHYLSHAATGFAIMALSPTR